MPTLKTAARETSLIPSHSLLIIEKCGEIKKGGSLPCSRIWGRSSFTPPYTRLRGRLERWSAVKNASAAASSPLSFPVLIRVYAIARSCPSH